MEFCVFLCFHFMVNISLQHVPIPSLLGILISGRFTYTFSNQPENPNWGWGGGAALARSCAHVSILAAGHTPSPPRGFSHWNFTFRKEPQPSPSTLFTFAGITEHLRKFPSVPWFMENLAVSGACSSHGGIPRTPHCLQERAGWRGREIHACICRDYWRQPTCLKN